MRIRSPAGATTPIVTDPPTSNLLARVKQGARVVRAFTYDAAGNTTKDMRGSTAYSYTINDAGRISQLTIGSTVTAKYTCGVEGRLSVRRKDRLSVRQNLNRATSVTRQSSTTCGRCWIRTA